MMRFNQSVTTESEKNINNLFFKITQLRFFYMKNGLVLRRHQAHKVDRQNRNGYARLNKFLNDYQSIIPLRVYQLHLGVIIF